MDNQTTAPESPAKPAELLPAWLVGLLAVDTCFLIAATEIGPGSWESHALVVAAIINVPLFLAAAFLTSNKDRR